MIRVGCLKIEAFDLVGVERLEYVLHECHCYACAVQCDAEFKFRVV